MPPRRSHQQPISQLSEQERAEAQRIAARLGEELARILLALPAQARTAAGLARHLGIKRFSCQELLSALESLPPGPSTLTRVPGIAALTNIVTALRTTVLDESLVNNFESAVCNFADFLERVGGNQRTLAKRLHADDAIADFAPATINVLSAPRAVSTPEPEQLLYAAAKKLIGCWGKTQISTQIVAPCHDQPTLVELSWAMGIYGHTVRWGSPPLVFRYSRGGEEGISLPPTSDEQLQSQHPRVLAEFCSTPTPRLTTSVNDGHNIWVVDQPPEKPVDVMTSKQARLPAPYAPGHPSRTLELWVAANRPVEEMLIDFFIHESLARDCRVDLDVHLLQALQGVQKGGRWSTRLPNKPPLRLLGMGIADVDSPFHSRQSELLAFLMKEKGWNCEEFVGYRCEIAYPLWHMAYRILLDFNQPSIGAV